MTGSRRARVTVVTSGHLSTCPRMLKSADALHAAGYDVRVIATLHEPWATATDRDVASRRSWKADTIDYRRGEGGATYWWSGARYRTARAAASTIGPGLVRWQWCHAPSAAFTRSWCGRSARIQVI